MGSLQFAGAILDTSLFVVLGHEKCGAVQAALEWQLYGRQSALAHSNLGGFDRTGASPSTTR